MLLKQAPLSSLMLMISYGISTTKHQNRKRRYLDRGQVATWHIMRIIFMPL